MNFLTVEDSSSDELGISSESESLEDLDFCGEVPMHGAKVSVGSDLNKFISGIVCFCPWAQINIGDVKLQTIRTEL